MSTPPAPDPSRQAPQYGEYATPEEVAAITGVPPTPAAPLVPAPDVSARRPTAAPTGARRFDRPVTVGLLTFGVFMLFLYGPVLLDLAMALQVSSASGVLADARFGEAATIGGRVLFGILLVLLVTATWWSTSALRAGRVTFWIPLTAGLIGIVAFIVTMVIVLVLTPGALPSGT